MDLATVREGFVNGGLPAALVDELLASYTETKRRYHLRDLRPQEVEGGRFCEAAFRIVQHATGQAVTPVGKSLPTVDRVLTACENATGADSLRLHIPRTLRPIYDIRSKRDAAHLGDGIDPNLQDATLVVSAMDWVLAELVRLFHEVTADQAQEIIEDLVTREVPAVQEIAGQPVILADLKPRDQALLILYRAGSDGATLSELAGWLRAQRKDHLRTRLLRLDDERLVLHHPRTDRFYLTAKGIKDVEGRGLVGNR